MASTFLLGLHGNYDVAAGNCSLDLFAPLADDDHAPVGAESIHAVEQMEKQGTAGDRVKHFVRIRAHARALARGKNDNSKTALIAHRRSNGMALKPAPEFR
jgi:hypothetical protein